VISLGAKIRAIRRSKHLSLREIAGKAGVSISHLSQVESGKTNPSVSSLLRIAAALSVPLDQIWTDEEQKDVVELPESEEQQAYASGGSMGEEQMAIGRPDLIGVSAQDAEAAQELTVVRTRRPASFVVHPDTRARIQLMGGVSWERLTPGQEENFEFREICYEIGSTSGPMMQYHIGREFGMILQGTCLIEVGFEQYELHVGDTCCFDSTLPHRLSNIGNEPMRAIWVTYNDDKFVG